MHRTRSRKQSWATSPRSFRRLRPSRSEVCIWSKIQNAHIFPSIALDRTSHHQDKFIRLPRKGFEVPLVDRPGSTSLVVNMPALCMGDGDPAEHFGEFPIVAWSEKQMAVSGHLAIGCDSDSKLGLGFCQDRFKSNVACRRFKEGKPTDQMIQGVTDKFPAARRDRRGIWSTVCVSTFGFQEKTLDPFKFLLADPPCFFLISRGSLSWPKWNTFTQFFVNSYSENISC
jgi:hypothetical protein